MNRYHEWFISIVYYIYSNIKQINISLSFDNGPIIELDLLIKLKDIVFDSGIRKSNTINELIFVSECSYDDNNAIYEEITTLTRVTPPPILRNDVLSFDVLSFWEDDVSPTPLLLVPRPKVGWTNRKVTFVGKKTIINFFKKFFWKLT